MTTNRFASIEQVNPGARNESNPRRQPPANPAGAPADHSRAAAEFPGEHFPRDAGAKDKYNSSQASPIGYARASTLRLESCRRQERSNKVPRIIESEGLFCNIQQIRPSFCPILHSPGRPPSTPAVLLSVQSLERTGSRFCVCRQVSTRECRRTHRQRARVGLERSFTELRIRPCKPALTVDHFALIARWSQIRVGRRFLRSSS
jgi:hypothetical protein